MKISSYWLKIIGLLVLCALFSTLYLTYNTYGNFAFAFALRGKKFSPSSLLPWRRQSVPSRFKH